MMKQGMLSQWSAWFLLWLALAPSLAVAAQYSIHPSGMDVTADKGKHVELTVTDGMPVDIVLARIDGAAESIDLVLTHFRDERGNILQVKLQEPLDKGAPQTELHGILGDRPLLSLRLAVPPMNLPGPYTGQLLITQAENISEVFSISLTRAPIKSSAKLAISPEKIELNHTRAFLGPSAGPSFSVQIREASGEWPLQGIGVHLLELKGPQGEMDPKHTLLFKINDHPIPDIWYWPADKGSNAGMRSLVRGGEALVEGVFQDLAAGQYSTKLRFVAANVQGDGGQELVITTNVRHSWAWAGLCLIAAVLCAYGGTKGLQIIRDRASFRARIHTLRKQLNRLPNAQRGEAIPIGLPEVWARSVLRQAEQWSNRLLLSGIDVITQRVDAAERIIGLLGRVGELKDRAYELPKDTLPRFQANLGRIVRAIGAGPLSDTEKADIETRLNVLENWLNLDTLPDLYEAEVNPGIERLLIDVQSDALTEPAKTLAQKLEADLSSPVATGQPLRATLAREKKYAMLLLIWQRQDDKELTPLVEAYNAGQAMEKIFAMADAAAWERMKQAADDGAFRFIAPNADNPIRAFEPTHFEIEPTKDSTLKQTFLFRHRLHYMWELRVTQGRRQGNLLTRVITWLLTTLHIVDRKEPLSAPLRPVSLEPRVTQFSPAAGEMTINVRVQFKSEEIKIEGPQIRVEESTDFVWRRAFEFAEIVALLIAGAVAVVTGLETFYLNNVGFGSAKDYVSLFLWGAGVDVTKTFVQQLQTRPRQAGAGSS